MQRPLSGVLAVEYKSLQSLSHAAIAEVQWSEACWKPATSELFTRTVCRLRHTPGVARHFR